MGRRAEGPRKHPAWWYARSVVLQTWRHPSNARSRLRSLARAVGWQLRKQVTSKPKDVDFFGYTLRCYPDSGSASNVLYFGELVEPESMGFCQRYLRPGDGFIDAGANIGTYSLLAASIVGPTGWVVAYEPDPIAARRFHENMRLNGIDNYLLHAACVADSTGTTEFLSGLDVSNQMLGAAGSPQPTRSVPTVTLDDTLEGHRYALGKLDVEGAESRALRGAHEHLAAADPPVWVVEMMDWQLRRLGSSYAELIQIFDDYGFVLAEFQPTTGCLEYLSHQRAAGRSHDQQRDHPNLIAVHRSHRSHVDGRLQQPDRHRT